jgi:hypothetical protein
LQIRYFTKIRKLATQMLLISLGIVLAVAGIVTAAAGSMEVSGALLTLSVLCVGTGMYRHNRRR